MGRIGKFQRFCLVQSKNPTLAAASPQPPLTAEEYGTLQDAYDHFNVSLFDGRLPQVLITLQRHARARGYFSRNRFQRRDGQEQIHEIALNPDCFNGRTDEEILSTLAHEMAHVWQQEYGYPGRGRYHNREWAASMYSIGLMPSATGEPGGAMTGDRMTHFIIDNGRFSLTCRAFLEKYRLVWESSVFEGSARGLGGNRDGDGHVEVKTQTRTKLTCPNCGLNAWAKPDAVLDCHSCSKEAGEPVALCPIEESGDNGPRER